MDQMNRISWRWWFALGVAGATLLFLAVLQFRWIMTVSHAEVERLRAHIAADVEKTAHDFDDDVSRAVRALIQGAPDVESFRRRYQDSRGRSVDAGMIKSVYLFDRGELKVFDPSSSRFLAARWPDELAGMRLKLEGVSPPITVLVDGAAPAVAVVRRRQLGPARRPPREGPERDAPPPGGFRGPPPGFQPPPWARGPRGPMMEPFEQSEPDPWAIVVLDGDILRSQVLPRIIGQNIREDDTGGYGIRVVTNDVAQKLIYSNTPENAPFNEPEASAVLMEIRLGGGLRQGRPPQGEPRQGPAGGFLTAAPAAWRIEAKHRKGSLENAVRGSRNVNLGVSAVTFALIAAAISAVVILARRSQRLAGAQMEFVAGVSHELRTPLSVICSAADNLADGVIVNEQGVRRYGGVIRAEGRRLGAMVEQILRFAGAQSGKARYQFESVSPQAVVDRALGACEQQLRESNAEFIREVGEDLPLIRADVTALSHALRNLIENALVHGVEGKWIQLSVRAAGGQVEFTVADHGPGIPRSERKQIFDPFFRGRHALDNQVHGFGLGLALVKRIAEAHDGAIDVESNASGSAFTLKIPGATRP